MASIYRAYDIRGIYPTDINESNTEIIGRQCAHLFDSGSIIIGRDGRHGSVSLRQAFAHGLLLEGKKLNKVFTIVDANITTSPMFYFLVNHHKAAGGAMITASHNPKEYNGIKAVRPGAIIISGKEIEKVTL